MSTSSSKIAAAGFGGSVSFSLATVAFLTVLTSCGGGGDKQARVLSASLVEDAPGTCAIEGEADGGEGGVAELPCFSSVSFEFLDAEGNSVPQSQTDVSVPSGTRSSFHVPICRRLSDGALFLAGGGFDPFFPSPPQTQCPTDGSAREVSCREISGFHTQGSTSCSHPDL